MRKTHIALNTSYSNSQVEDQQHISCKEFIQKFEGSEKNSEMTNSYEL